MVHKELVVLLQQKIHVLNQQVLLVPLEKVAMVVLVVLLMLLLEVVLEVVLVIMEAVVHLDFVMVRGLVEEALHT